MFSLLVSSLLATAAIAAPSSHDKRGEDLTTWMEAQHPVAIDGIFNNVGESGWPKSRENAKGAAAGVFVASPSKVNPNYYYTWTRDSAIAIKALVDDFLANETPKVEEQIRIYIDAQAMIQNITTPSGSTCDGGLGETRFQVNMTATNDDWPRPQRDGPALRVTALVAYGRYLLDTKQEHAAKTKIWPIVQNDLAYVSENWNKSTYDLWESIESSSMFATAVQYRALVEGNGFAASIGEKCPNCESQAPQVLCFLQSYWNGKYMIANTGGGRSGIDVPSILASIHVFDPEAPCDDTSFQPCSEKALANHKIVTDSFREIFPMNKDVPAHKAVAVGRYPEDEYMGGNPWYLSNFAAAEQIYDALAQWKRQGKIVITEVSYPFWQVHNSTAQLGTFESYTQDFKNMIEMIGSYAENFMEVARKFTPSDGSLTEQFDKNNGKPQSARDLTWSYAAFISAYNARKGALPASWAAGQSKEILPSECAPTSAKGACSPPLKMDWPLNDRNSK